MSSIEIISKIETLKEWEAILEDAKAEVELSLIHIYGPYYPQRLRGSGRRQSFHAGAQGLEGRPGRRWPGCVIVCVCAMRRAANWSWSEFATTRWNASRWHTSTNLREKSSDI